MDYDAPYRLKPRTGILSTLFFAGCAVVLFMDSQKPGGGARHPRLIAWMEATDARLVLLVLSVLSALFVVGGALVTYKGLRGRDRIQIKDGLLCIPAGLPLQKPRQIALKDVVGVFEQKINGQRLLGLRVGTKTRHLSLNMLPSRAEEARFVAVLAEAIATARAGL